MSDPTSTSTDGEGLPASSAEVLAPKAAKVVPHPTIAERVEQGKAARSRCPREGHAGWQAAPGRPDPIALLEAQAATRVPELVPIRHGRMLASPFAFYRGAAAIMAADLAALPHSGLHAQLCGDAHVSNFGAFASPERTLVLDVNDFDETLPGPWEWDLKRLAASIEVAARDRGFDAVVRRGLVLGAVAEYRGAMREFASMGNLDVWYLHLDPTADDAPRGLSAKLKALRRFDAGLAGAPHRDNVRAFEKLTCRVDGQLRIAAHPPLVVPLEDLMRDQGQAQLTELMRGLIRSYRHTLQSDRRHLLESFEYVHMARKVVGVGSVGTRTWILLLVGRDDADPLFLQAKEAEASVLEPYLGKSKLGDHGQRIVDGQRRMQSVSDIFLGWERIPTGMDGRSHDYFIRQLWDWKISADIETMAPPELMVYGQVCAWTLARAHARSGDRVAIASYVGKSGRLDEALAQFATDYADQNERDYQALADAVNQGRVEAATGV